MIQGGFNGRFNIGGPTIAQRLTDTDGRPSGFDYIRVILAASVVVYHTIVVSYGTPAQEAFRASWWGVLVPAIVPLFFGVSGFLIAGSLDRCRTVVSFFGLRILRIFPALTWEVLLSALILGPLLTTIPWHDYFSDRLFWRYFLNIAGDTHYRLPGLFANNPVGLVNGQLWTIPFELFSYSLLGVAAIFGLFKKRARMLALYILLLAVALGWAWVKPAIGDRGFPGGSLAATFFAAVLLYQFRDRIVWHAPMALVTAVIMLLLLRIADTHPVVSLLPPVFTAYTAVYLGLLDPPRQRVLLSGDYSYGLYIYGYPVQQAVAALSPALRQWYWNLLIALPCAFVIAVASWWLVERPALAQKNHVKAIEGWYLKLRGKRSFNDKL